MCSTTTAVLSLSTKTGQNCNISLAGLYATGNALLIGKELSEMWLICHATHQYCASSKR